MSVEIKYTTEETFKFKEFEFQSSKRKIKEITVKAPTYQDRKLMIDSLPSNPDAKHMTQAMFDLAVKKSGLTPEEFMELPDAIAEAIMGFLTPTA